MKTRIQDKGSQTPAHDAFYGSNFESIEKHFIVQLCYLNIYCLVLYLYVCMYYSPTKG